MAKVTRADYVHSQRPSPIKHPTFGGVAEGIKAGAIEVYYEDGKILIDEDQADAYLIKKIDARLNRLKAIAAPREKVDLFS